MTRWLCIVALSVSACQAADGTPEGLQKLIRAAMANLDKSEGSLREFTFVMSVETREPDGHGGGKWRSTVLRREYVDGVGVSRVISRNGVPASEADRQKEEQEIQKRLAENRALSSAERTKREEQTRKRRREEESWIREFPTAMACRQTGVEAVRERKTVVLECSPRPGYRPQNLRARLFEKAAGKLWIDEQDAELVIAEARLLGDVTVGWGLLGRINQGSTFRLERIRLEGGTWLPFRQKYDYSGRMLIKTVRKASSTEYSDFSRRAEGSRN